MTSAAAMRTRRIMDALPNDGTGPTRWRDGGSAASPSVADSAAAASDFVASPPSLRLEIHCHAVDAIAQVGGRRAVLEHVAEMAAAAAAMHLGAHHPEALVRCGLGRARHRIVEARPASAALELGLRHEQGLIASGADEGTGALFVIERAAAGSFGAVLAHDVVLLGREQAAPLGVGAGDRVDLGVHRSSSVGLSLRRVSAGN